jgi:hypothetical protein
MRRPFKLSAAFAALARGGAHDTQPQGYLEIAGEWCETSQCRLPRHSIAALACSARQVQDRRRRPHHTNGGPVAFALSDDRTIVIVVQPSGGRPDFKTIAQTSPYQSVLGPRADILVGPQPTLTTLATASLYYRGFATEAIGSAILHWLLNRIVFRSGWTVHIDAPDCDPIKLRCANQAAAETKARDIAADIERRGEAAVAQL